MVSQSPAGRRKPQGRRPQNANHNSTLQKKLREGYTPKGLPKLRAVILGGLNEVGKNCMAFEYGDDIVVIDSGLAFPNDDMWGVDYIIPDTDYLEHNKHKIRAVVVTHGHLDHIGSLAHTLPKMNFPQIITMPLTAGLINRRLDEHNLTKKVNVDIVKEPDTERRQLGKMQVEFFRVNHSIPDCMGVVIKTPAGTAVHTGDFKFDFTPHDDKPASMERMTEIGKQGVDILFCESTNATKPGNCMSEAEIGANLEKVILSAKGRIILASFSSLVSRIQFIVEAAHKCNRKVFISGRSMQETLEVGNKLGHFKVPKGSVKRLSNAVDELPANEVLILTTGSQGEPRSALSRISVGEHNQISIQKGDTVVFSSSPIPGNETGVYNTINNLIKLGAEVITNNDTDIHVSGHGYQEEIKLMHQMMKPRYVVPIHGEMYMRHAHKKLIMHDLGRDPKDIMLLENGSILEMEKGKRPHKSKSKVQSNMIFVDGLGVGDVGTQVLNERKMMGNSGIVVVLMKVDQRSRKLQGLPDIITKGLIYFKQSEGLVKQAQKEAQKSYEKIIRENQKSPAQGRQTRCAAQCSDFDLQATWT